MKVRVKEEGIKLNGTWKFQGEEAVIDEEQYEKNKEFIDIIEDEEGPTLPQIPSGDEDNEKDAEEIELVELRKKAKELGVRNCHLMGKERLEQVIAEIEAPVFGSKNEEDESDEGTEKNVADNQENNKEETGENEDSQE